MSRDRETEKNKSVRDTERQIERQTDKQTERLR
jgi:hypothetical protein